MFHQLISMQSSLSMDGRHIVALFGNSLIVFMLNDNGSEMVPFEWGSCATATVTEALTIDLFRLTVFLFLFARRNLEGSMLGGKVGGQVIELGCR